MSVELKLRWCHGLREPRTQRIKARTWAQQISVLSQFIATVCRKSTFLLSQLFWKRIQEMIGFTTISTICTENPWCEWGMLQLNTALIVLPFLLSFITGKSSIQAPVQMRLGVRIKYPNIKECHFTSFPESSCSYI